MARSMAWARTEVRGAGLHNDFGAKSTVPHLMRAEHSCWDKTGADLLFCHGARARPRKEKNRTWPPPLDEKGYGVTALDLKR